MLVNHYTTSRHSASINNAVCSCFWWCYWYYLKVYFLTASVGIFHENIKQSSVDGKNLIWMPVSKNKEGTPPFEEWGHNNSQKEIAPRSKRKKKGIQGIFNLFGSENSIGNPGIDISSLQCPLINREKRMHLIFSETRPARWKSVRNWRRYQEVNAKAGDREEVYIAEKPRRCWTWPEWKGMRMLSQNMIQQHFKIKTKV